MSAAIPGSHVWVMEHGEYEQRSVWNVYSSPQSALTDLRATYGGSYIVRWDDIVFQAEDNATITGHFEHVTGFSTKHTGEYELTRYEIDRIGPFITPGSSLDCCTLPDGGCAGCSNCPEHCVCAADAGEDPRTFAQHLQEFNATRGESWLDDLVARSLEAASAKYDPEPIVPQHPENDA